MQRNKIEFTFENVDSVRDNLGWTRFDSAKSVQLYPNHDVLTIIEEAHHVETAIEHGFWGEEIRDPITRDSRARILENAWEDYAKPIGAKRWR